MNSILHRVLRWYIAIEYFFYSTFGLDYKSINIENNFAGDNKSLILKFNIDFLFLEQLFSSTFTFN